MEASDFTMGRELDLLRNKCRGYIGPVLAAPTPQVATNATAPEFDLVLRGNYAVRFVLWRHRQQVELAVQPLQGCKHAGTVARIHADGKRLRLSTTLDKYRRLDASPVCEMYTTDAWSMGRGVPHHRYIEYDVVTEMCEFAFAQLYTEPIEGRRRWGREGRARARAVMADVRTLLDEFGRLALAGCDSRSLEVVRPFRPATRWRLYSLITADESGRLGQLAVSCPGALLFALAIDADAPKSPIPASICRDAMAGKPLPKVLDAAIDQWIEQPSFEALMMDGAEAAVWHSLARLNSRQRARLRSKKRVLLTRAREVVRLEDMLKPPPRRFAPEDTPTQRWPNARWYRVMAGVPEFLGTGGRNTETLEGLCSCVSANAGDMKGRAHEVI